MGATLAAYYQPVLNVLRQRPTEPREAVDAVYTVAEFPEADLTLGLDQAILDALSVVSEESARHERLLGRLAERARGERNHLRHEQEGRVWQTTRAAEETETRRSIGVDGVLVDLGDAWSDEQLTRQPEDRRPSP